jgi:hypothetical protein
VLALDTPLDTATKFDEQIDQDKKILTFADFCKTAGINLVDSQENRERAKLFTPEMILSHQTGLPIVYNNTPDPKYGNKPAPIKFDFEPGEGYGYSGLHLMYLQQWIEEKTGRKLQDLAKEYVFDPAGMTNSSFNNPEANAANSLYTTAEDYARFCIHWMQDQDPLVQDAFTTKVSLTNDPWAVRECVSPTALEHLAGGYGWGLEKNDAGDVIGAFHTGDMGPWRAGVQLDLIKKNVTVFFTKSTYENGHVLQEQVFGRSYALDYFFDKYKFARNPDELQSDWREKQHNGIRDETSRLSKVKEPEITHDESRMKMQEKYRRISEQAASTQSAPQAASTKEREEHNTPKPGSNYATPADKLKNPFSTILTKK